MIYSKDEAFELCEKIIPVFLEKGLRDDLRNSIVPKCLNQSVCIGEVSDDIEYDIVGSKTENLDPMLDYDKFTADSNSELLIDWGDEEHGLTNKKTKKELAAIEKQMEAMRKQRKPKAFVPVYDSNANHRMDVLVNNVSVIVAGKTLLENASLKLTCGRKYGLVGRNGIGKTTLLNMIACKEIENFPMHLNVLHVEQEIDAEDKTVIQHMFEHDNEKERLNKELDELTADESKSNALEKAERIELIQKRLVDIETHEEEAKTSNILSGFGFKEEDLNKKSSNFSGGWRMKISLAKALFSNPDILLLDEPTNHLDLDAVLWLEEYVKNLDYTVIVVSHDRDFLNNVAEEIIHFQDNKLDYYKGNYDQFEKTRTELIKQQKKQMDAQTKQVDHLQKFIDKFRYNAKRAALVQSRIKTLNRMELIDEIAEDPTCVFIFPDPEMLNPPILRLTEASIGYGKDKVIARDVTIDINMESRIAIVGPNGAGKTTLLKSLTEELATLDGTHYSNRRLRIGLFSQHHVDALDLRLSAVEQMMEMFGSYNTQEYRSHLGSFGLSGNLSIRPMFLLSGGQKSRVVFALITFTKPHLLILDEPTNHLDMDAINALIIALENYKGGLVIVSHDQYFVSSLCQTIYNVRNGAIKKFDGGFDEYKQAVISNSNF